MQWCRGAQTPAGSRVPPSRVQQGFPAFRHVFGSMVLTVYVACVSQVQATLQTVIQVAHHCIRLQWYRGLQNPAAVMFHLRVCSKASQPAHTQLVG
jgi:hypothetical protein